MPAKINKAVGILQRLAEDFDEDLLELVSFMKDHLDRFTPEEQEAYKLFAAEMKNLFK